MIDGLHISFTPPDPTFAAEWNLTYDSSQLGQTGPINATFINYFPECEKAVEPAGLEVGLDIVRAPVSDPDRAHSTRETIYSTSLDGRCYIGRLEDPCEHGSRCTDQGILC